MSSFQIRFVKVWLDLWMLISPLVPYPNSLLEDLHMLLVRHLRPPYTQSSLPVSPLLSIITPGIFILFSFSQREEISVAASKYERLILYLMLLLRLQDHLK